MLTIEQIRAARALLDWSQQDLAEYADLSQTGIARIENGTNKPNSKTLNKIETAFDRADIEFIGTTGLRKRDGTIKTLSGTQGFREVMNEIYDFAKNDDAEICLFNGLPNLFIKWLEPDWYDMHSKRMGKLQNNFKLKIIVKEKETNLIAGSFAEYRYFPENLFHEQVFYCYNGKLAILNFTEDSVYINVLTEQKTADSFAVLFNVAWDHVAVKIEGNA